MSANSQSTLNRSDRLSWNCRSEGANWSGINIATMVAGFVFLWPLGLFMLFWILTGRDAQELPGAIRSFWKRAKASWGSSDSNAGDRHSGNSIFNEFQQTQYDRIRELKEEIRGRARRFKEYRSEARRQADQTEFDSFMASTPEQDKR